MTPLLITDDEGVRPGTTAESLAKLRPAFAADGAVTAGSASQISDGAAAVVVMSRATAEELGAPILAEIGAHGTVAEPDPSLLSQPSNAIVKVLNRENLPSSNVDQCEINEAAAVTTHGLSAQPWRSAKTGVPTGLGTKIRSAWPLRRDQVGPSIRRMSQGV